MSKRSYSPLASSDGEVVALVLRNRRLDSYFAGSAIVAEILGRRPDDYDIHHPNLPAMAAAIERDRSIVEGSGGRCIIYSETTEEVKARVELAGTQVKLDWVLDDQPHIIGAGPDIDWGYCLHPFDVCVHKIIKAAKCGMTKDLVDLLSIHERLYSLAALAWAAPSREATIDPDQVLTALGGWWLRRGSEEAVVKSLLPRAQTAVQEARYVCQKLPDWEKGCVYLRYPITPVHPSEDRACRIGIRPVTASGNGDRNGTAGHG